MDHRKLITETPDEDQSKTETSSMSGVSTEAHINATQPNPTITFSIKPVLGVFSLIFSLYCLAIKIVFLFCFFASCPYMFQTKLNSD